MVQKYFDEAHSVTKLKEMGPKCLHRLHEKSKVKYGGSGLMPFPKSNTIANRQGMDLQGVPQYCIHFVFCHFSAPRTWIVKLLDIFY